MSATHLRGSTSLPSASAAKRQEPTGPAGASHGTNLDARSVLQRQGERRRETERRISLHIATYRRTHPTHPDL
jgi:hypothetical protein